MKIGIIGDQRDQILISRGLSIADRLSWIAKWQSLKDRSKRKNTGFSLTFENYIDLAVQANLTSPDQIGKQLDKYQMGRIGDVGPYEIGNCRFITFEQNMKEMGINGGRESQIEKIRGRNKHNHPSYAYLSNLNSKTFKLISPSGDEYQGSNLKQFCLDNGLNQGSMSAVCRGVDRQHKGWRGTYV